MDGCEQEDPFRRLSAVQLLGEIVANVAEDDLGVRGVQIRGDRLRDRRGCAPEVPADVAVAADEEGSHPA